MEFFFNAEDTKEAQRTQRVWIKCWFKVQLYLLSFAHSLRAFSRHWVPIVKTLNTMPQSKRINEEHSQSRFFRMRQAFSWQLKSVSPRSLRTLCVLCVKTFHTMLKSKMINEEQWFLSQCYNLILVALSVQEKEWKWEAEWEWIKAFKWFGWRQCLRAR